MPLYATSPSSVSAVEEVSCSCAACRFGHGAGRPARPRRYTTDMTDTEWQAIAPLLPWPTWLDGNGGRPEEYCRRLVIDAICYVADNGNKWRNLPVDYGIHWKTLHATFTRWSRDGFTLALHNDLREKVREAEGRDREPSAAVIDSQSIRAAETVGADSRGWDAGKKVGGRKRHVIVDTIGNDRLLH